ncbi:MAG: CIA30 family protein [Planctomycetota bacterium]
MFLLITLGATASPDRFATDFNNGTEEWRVVVDGVMGGLSTGYVVPTEPGIMLFTGNLSLENNGGFSQIRRPVEGSLFDGSDGIEITVRGDGRSYRFDVRCSNARVRAGGYQQTFDTVDGEWRTIRMSYDDFVLLTFGRQLRNAPPLTPGMIESIGFTQSEKREGSFLLEVSSIRAYDDAAVARATTNARPSTAATLRSILDERARERSEIEVASESTTAARLRSVLNERARQREQSLDQDNVTVSASASLEAARLTELAINRGVPLFNNGQHVACAAIYEIAIEAMLALGADDLGDPVVNRLQHGLDEARHMSQAADRAWAYRQAMDVAYVQLIRQSDMTRTVNAH